MRRFLRVCIVTIAGFTPLVVQSTAQQAHAMVGCTTIGVAGVAHTTCL